MNAGKLFRNLLVFPVGLLSLSSSGQDHYNLPASYLVKTGDNTMVSNVPLNEINIHAFRQFRKQYPNITGESWVKTDEEYIVSFTQLAIRHQAHFDRKGYFLYSLCFYGPADLDKDLAKLINTKFPDYVVDVVTEISDGDKKFYLIKIENRSSVKTISITDGRMEIIEDLVNGKFVK